MVLDVLEWAGYVQLVSRRAFDNAAWLPSSFIECMRRGAQWHA
jgi:hypothetical protein